MHLLNIPIEADDAEGDASQDEEDNTENNNCQLQRSVQAVCMRPHRISNALCLPQLELDPIGSFLCGS